MYDHTDTVLQKLQAGTAHLPGWTACLDDHGRVELRHPNGPRIHVHIDNYRHKITFSGIYPSADTPRESARPVCTVSIERDGVAICRDVARRLVPAYLEAYPASLAALAKERERQALVANRTDDLAQVCTGRVHHRNEVATIYLNTAATYITARTSYDGQFVEVDRCTLPYDLALEVFALIGKYVASNP